MRVTEVPIAIGFVWEFLADFRHSILWQPGTLTAVRVRGHGGVGTVHRTTSSLPSHDVDVPHTVIPYRPLGRLDLNGTRDLLSVETTFELERCAVGSRVSHSHHVRPIHAVETDGPLSEAALDRAADETARLLASCLRRLPRTPRGLTW